MANNLVEFRNLRTNFYTSGGVVKAVNDVSFAIKEGETLCVVGESGCGKSVTAMSLMRLVSPPGKTEGGQILYNGEDLLTLKERQMRHIRGNEIAMIFQEPMTSLNPVFKIGQQISEPLIIHKGMTKKEAKKRSIELIELVGIPRAAQIFDSYPHELSGGMRQRIMIAIALSCDPKLLIADEPTTALDVTIQAQILDLMRNIKSEFKTAIMLITHDLGVVAEMADHVVVMYAGKVIEEAPVHELFRNPKHPYTQGLLRAKPIINQRQSRLYTIPGQVPNPVSLGNNCYFNDRCEHCMSICVDKQPPLNTYENRHKAACWLYEKGGEA
ncbi:ABC transporter ATP-binding protein [Paenibacillus taiwanensis]|uniref:ABC transporter ATP-binding protein n=1 Tax=Paenibacillus taiwanensis TaxID=401638 RepID=UPI0003F88A60|nr:ABC transporter ATP-binding protein [Paenibacillus taiwanensis]